MFKKCAVIVALAAVLGSAGNALAGSYEPYSYQSYSSAKEYSSDCYNKSHSYHSYYCYYYCYYACSYSYWAWYYKSNGDYNKAKMYSSYAYTSGYYAYQYSNQDYQMNYNTYHSSNYDDKCWHRSYYCWYGCYYSYMSSQG